jgi:hypothetical protein
LVSWIRHCLKRVYGEIGLAISQRKFRKWSKSAEWEPDQSQGLEKEKPSSLIMYVV